MALVLKWFKRPTLKQSVAFLIVLVALVFVASSGNIVHLIKSSAIVLGIMWTMWHVISYFIDEPKS
tara:strand:+ start:320 stop:517 length:198 start_codon:yes stop_codon:yes gene_type:complete